MFDIFLAWFVLTLLFSIFVSTTIFFNEGTDLSLIKDYLATLFNIYPDVSDDTSIWFSILMYIARFLLFGSIMLIIICIKLFSSSESSKRKSRSGKTGVKVSDKLTNVSSNLTKLN